MKVKMLWSGKKTMSCVPRRRTQFMCRIMPYFYWRV